MTPKISIITPSYNQGQFIEDTILSVIGQQYPNLEYIIIDGGSTDRTVEVIKKYEEHLTYWVSEPDRGQAHAINKGFSMATGDILAWLNSDDMYMPGALLHVAERMELDEPQIFFGNCLHFDEHNPKKAFSRDTSPAATAKDLLNDSVIQPSTFWTRSVWSLVGELLEHYHYVFDLEWFSRCKEQKVVFKHTPRHLSIYRIHENHKTGIGGEKRLIEIAKVYDILLNTNGMYLEAMQSLLKGYNKHFIRMERILRYKPLYYFVLNLFFPKLKKVDNEYYEVFAGRIKRIFR